ncbi:N4-gp56 family major capsid protein [Reyranella sp. CPCC 100927]|uniref:N4-gp56 family major capsid protein n=1 Tax=Reyranella sp. CPCC 100927 TaxID=2599616 RepID=UPI0015B6C79A|nr:N4-gp56 family major capsid protein [Reyranella sp. CPCC 100927]
MAATDFPVGHPLVVKLWQKRIWREALKETMAMKFMGTSSNSLIQILDETSKGAGDRIRVPLRMQLAGRGVGETEALEGNEESLLTFYDDVLINDLAHAVRNKTRIDQQRVPWSMREESAAGLRDWFAERIDTWAANVLAGNSGVSDLLYTGNQTATAPTTTPNNTRIIYADGLSTSEASLSASQTFNLTMLDTAVTIAKTATPLIRPVKVGSQEYYVAFLHPYQVRNMRQNTNPGQWLDIQKAAMAGGEVEDNPIFTGALGVYNGVVLHEWVRLPAAPTNANTRRAVFAGAQAAAMCFGKGYSEEPLYEEQSFDYGRQFGQSVQTIAGMKKMVFGGVDFGTIVISTWAVAP